MRYLPLLLIGLGSPSCVGPDPSHDSAASVVERALGGGGRSHQITGGVQKSGQPSAEEVPASQAEAEKEHREIEEYLSNRREQIRVLAGLMLTMGRLSDVRVMWELSRKAAAQGEFETSEVADQRRTEFYSQHFYLDISDAPKGSGKTVAMARLKRATEARTDRLRYDMDRRALLVRVASGFTGSKVQRLKLFDETTSTKYEGHNAFGASATVERMVGDSYVVDLRNLNAFVAGRNRMPIDEIREDWFAEVPMEPALVRDRIEKVKVLAVVMVDREFGSWQEQLSDEPTFRIPLETSIQVHITSCWLEALVVYDGEDRTILQVVVDPTLRSSGT
jgi:hypothetical protein